MLWLLTGFAPGALLLAGVGIYGTVSQSVVQRQQEIGLRMALGASPGAALGLVFGDGIRLTGFGSRNSGCSAADTDPSDGQTALRVQPLDPVTFPAAAVIRADSPPWPAMYRRSRATRVDPLVALRQD